MRRWIVAAIGVALWAPVALGGDVAGSIAGSEWGFAGENAHGARSVQFSSGGAVHGFGGCNRFRGSYQQDGASLKIGPLASTRMACPQEKMKREAEFLDILTRTARARVTHLKLVLMDAAGDELATLDRRDFD